LLDVLAESTEGRSVSELADSLGIHRAGVYRLLAPLTARRLVERTTDRRYVLGSGLFELASRVRPQLQAIAIAELRRLSEQIGATTALTVPDGDDAIVAAVVEPRNTTVHISYRSGLRHRLDEAASGLAILAAMAPRAGERDAVRIARECGWAYTQGELLPGTSGVAAPIAIPGQDPAGSISAVWADDRDARTVGEQVVRVADAIAAQLS
jgi:DNA-binding IclR family transcriptional regulator